MRPSRQSRPSSMLAASGLICMLAASCGLPASQLTGTGSAGGMSGLAATDPYSTFQISPRLPAADGTRDLLSLNYQLADDEDLSPATQQALGPLTSHPSGDAYRVVFRDGGGTNDAQLFLSPGVSGPAASSLVAPGLTEVDSRDPIFFQKLLSWAVSRYPARERILNVQAHGLGILGLGSDSHMVRPDGTPIANSNPYLGLGVLNFASALRQATGEQPLEALYLNACLMGNIETLDELRDTAKVIIASEHEIVIDKLNTLDVPQAIEASAASGRSPQEIGDDAIRAIEQSPYRDEFRSAIAVEPQNLGPLMTAMRQLTGALLAGMQRDRSSILDAYDNVPTLDGAAPIHAYSHLRDLSRFCRNLLQVSDPAIQGAAQAVLSAEAAALSTAMLPPDGSTGGLSILLPVRNAVGDGAAYVSQFLRNQYPQTRFAQETGWGKFLLAVWPDPVPFSRLDGAHLAYQILGTQGQAQSSETLDVLGVADGQAGVNGLLSVPGQNIPLDHTPLPLALDGSLIPMIGMATPSASDFARAVPDTVTVPGGTFDAQKVMFTSGGTSVTYWLKTPFLIKALVNNPSNPANNSQLVLATPPTWPAGKANP